MLGKFGGSSPVIERVSGGGGTSPMGDFGSKAKLQTYGNIGDLPVGYWDVRARVFNSGNISIPDGFLTSLTFDSERWDTDGMHSTSVNTGRMTINTAGTYLIFVNIEWAFNTAGTRDLVISFNTGDPSVNAVIAITKVSGLAASFYNNPHHVSTHYNFSIGDYVTVQVYQNSGGALNITPNGNASIEFGIVKLP